MVFCFCFCLYFEVDLHCTQSYGIVFTEKIMLPLNLAQNTKTQRTDFRQHPLSDKHHDFSIMKISA